LAAYCLLVEETSATEVRTGILQYPNRTIEIAFDQTLWEKLQAKLVQIE
jgi:CRISPR/Cas system-associated exonuclease Cas4 (RecB family)